MKNFLLIIALFVTLNLFAADKPDYDLDSFLSDSRQSTIIDSVYSDSVLDGEIGYGQNDQELTVDNWMYDMDVGDSGVAMVYPDPNSYVRSYISFDLPIVPDGYIVDSVYVRLYQYLTIGNGDPSSLPIWNVTNGDTIKCIMSHINYGDALDAGDWEKGDLGNPYTFNHKVGIVTDSPAEGYRYIDVTDCVITDYEAGRSRSQYRIAFENIDTDWDGESDLVSFKTASSANEDQWPKLNLSFTIPSISDNNDISEPLLQLNNYPNPFNPTTIISYETSQPGNVTLKVFNLKGQLIETIIDEYQPRGKHTINWNADNQSSGIYFYRLASGNQTETGKCLLLK